MTKKIINTGTAANSKNGDSLRTAFTKINENFSELYTALGLNVDGTLNLGAFEFAGSVISTTDSTPIVIDQATTITSNLSVGGDILPQTANGGDLGSLARPFRSLYVSNNTVFLGGVPLSLDANNNLTVNGSPVTGGGNSFDQDLNTDDSVTFNSVGATTVNVSQINGTNPGDELVIQANNHNWTFDADGNLTLPAGGDILNSSGQSVLGGGNTGTIWTNDANGCLRAELSATGFEAFTDQSHVDLKDSGIWSIGSYGNSTFIGNNEFDNLNDLSLRSGDDTYITTNLRENGNHQWKFGTDGKLSFPNGSTIGDSDAVFGVPITTTRGSILIGNQAECLGGENHFHIMKAGQQEIDLFLGDDNNYVKLPSTGGVEISSSELGAQHYWTFGADGTLSFPDATVQTTAWTGDQTVSTTSSVEFNTVRSNILAPLTTGATRYTIANIAPESPYTNPVITITGTIGPEWVNGSQLEIKGVTTPTQANGTWYVQYRSANSFRLFNDAGLTSSPNASSWEAYTGNGIVKLSDSPANLTVVNNNNTWQFGTDGKLTLPTNGTISYAPDDSANWEDPTINTVQAALDELAARVTALQNFEIDGGNAYTPAAGELIIDGNGA